MAVLITQDGTLCSAFAGTGGTDSVNVQDGGVFALAITMTLAGSTAKIEQSVDGGTTWFLVFAQPSGAAAGLITTSGAVDKIWLITYPMGLYRVNVTAHVGNVTAKYMMGPSLWK